MFELQHLISADFCQVLPWKLICVLSLITLADVTSITDELWMGSRSVALKRCLTDLVTVQELFHHRCQRSRVQSLDQHLLAQEET